MMHNFLLQPRHFGHYIRRLWPLFNHLFCAGHAPVKMHLKVSVIVYVQLLEGLWQKWALTHTVLLLQGVVGSCLPHWAPLISVEFQLFLPFTVTSSASLMPDSGRALLTPGVGTCKGSGLSAALPHTTLLHLPDAKWVWRFSSPLSLADSRAGVKVDCLQLQWYPLFSVLDARSG